MFESRHKSRISVHTWVVELVHEAQRILDLICNEHLNYLHHVIIFIILILTICLIIFVIFSIFKDRNLNVCIVNDLFLFNQLRQIFKGLPVALESKG